MPEGAILGFGLLSASGNGYVFFLFSDVTRFIPASAKQNVFWSLFFWSLNKAKKIKINVP